MCKNEKYGLIPTSGVSLYFLFLVALEKAMRRAHISSDSLFIIWVSIKGYALQFMIHAGHLRPKRFISSIRLPALQIIYVWNVHQFMTRKMWLEIFFVKAQEFFISRAKTKKLTRHFFRADVY
ncbi:hypothetical protein HR17_07240 [Porphyromonas gulae]|nr:hypothetical protein HR17_07240 [Porphyromonas gulae]